MNPLQYRTRKPHKRQRNIKLRRGQYAIFMQCSFTFFNVNNHNTWNSPRNVLFQILHNRYTEQTHFTTIAGYVCNICLWHTTIAVPCKSAFLHVLVLPIRFDSNTAHQYLLFQQDYLKEGMLMKLCRKDMQERMFFLVCILPFFSNTLTGLRT